MRTEHTITVTDHIIMVIDPLDYIKKNPRVEIKNWCTLKAGCFLCEKCGETFSYDRPVRIDLAAGIAEVFRNLHKDCGKDEVGR